MKKACSADGKETHIFHGMIQSKLEAIVSYTLQPFENRVCCESTTPFQSLFSSGRNIHFKETKPEC
jgi:hypothetical protein